MDDQPRDCAAHELLRLCALPRPDDAACARAAGDPNLDWDAFLRLALQHKVAPLVHRALCGGASLQPRACAALERHTRALRLDQRFMAAELQRLLGALEHASIPVVVFKGAVLNAMAFEPFGAMREFGDIDLLVRAPDYAPAKAALARRGYRMLYDAAHERAVGQAQLMRADGRVSVDLHSRVAPPGFPGAPPEDLLWRRLVDFPLGGRNVRTFDADTTLLVVCLQGAKERWSWLSRVCDVAWLLAARGNMDWGPLLADTGWHCARRLLLLGAAMAQDLLEVPLPPDVQSACASDASVRRLAASAALRLRGRAPTTRLRLHDRHYFHYHLRRGLRQRVSYLASVAPSYLLPALSPRRWLRGAARRVSRSAGGNS